MSASTPPAPGIFERIRLTYHQFPAQFWVLVSATFIDRLGGALLFPFFTLYLTKKFSISMTQVGLIFMLFSVTSVAGSMIGGALTDRLGRKGMLLFGLIMSGLSSVLMGLVNELSLFLVITVLVGILADAAGPAQQAMVADLLPEEKRAQGYGILRVVANLAVTFGPLIGGFLAAVSYLLLFVSDAVTSLITAVIVYFVIKETRRPRTEDEPEETLAQTFKGYGKVLRDSAFVWFLAASLLMVLVYMQMNTTLAVYLRDQHGISEQGFGFILSLNAAMVVLLQFQFTRWIDRFRPLIVMTVGTLLYAVGFAMYGFVSVFFMFLVAMAIITVGEMLVVPVSQAIVARLAPEDMRGRYMAMYGFSWVIPTAVGPLLAGLVMDNYNPDWLWYLSGVVGVIAAGAYYFLEMRVGRSRYDAIDARLEVMRGVEDGEFSAAEGAQLLEAIGEGAWVKLTSPEAAAARRHLRIQVSDLETGAMKSDLRIPVGLVNTVLFVGGQLAPDLEGYDSESLHALLARNAGEKHAQDTDADHLEMTVE